MICFRSIAGAGRSIFKMGSPLIVQHRASLWLSCSHSRLSYGGSACSSEVSVWWYQGSHSSSKAGGFQEQVIQEAESKSRQSL